MFKEPNSCFQTARSKSLADRETLIMLRFSAIAYSPLHLSPQVASTKCGDQRRMMRSLQLAAPTCGQQNRSNQLVISIKNVPILSIKPIFL